MFEYKSVQVIYLFNFTLTQKYLMNLMNEKIEFISIYRLVKYFHLLNLINNNTVLQKMEPKSQKICNIIYFCFTIGFAIATLTSMIVNGYYEPYEYIEENLYLTTCYQVSNNTLIATLPYSIYSESIKYMNGANITYDYQLIMPNDPNYGSLQSCYINVCYSLCSYTDVKSNQFIRCNKLSSKEFPVYLQKDLGGSIGHLTGNLSLIFFVCTFVSALIPIFVFGLQKLCCKSKYRELV